MRSRYSDMSTQNFLANQDAAFPHYKWRQRQPSFELCRFHNCWNFVNSFLNFLAKFACEFAVVLPKKIMSWQGYVDNNLLATGKVQRAAIHGQDGSSWASSPDFKVSFDSLQVHLIHIYITHK